MDLKAIAKRGADFVLKQVFDYGFSIPIRIPAISW